ncbi:MAG TPA: hypothetical protein VFR67_10010, partial [Pilimelia sp.]|nr:hypothetical protein [Pilimelia sp.]
VSIAGLSDAQLRAVRRHAVGALGLGVTDRHQLDDGLDEFAHRRPTADVIRQRFGRLPRADHEAVAQLLIVTAGAQGVLEPPLITTLEAVFALLGQDAGELHRRLAELEVASVTFDSDPGGPIDTTVLDQDTVDQTLAAAVTGASLIARITAPPSQTQPQPRWYAATTAGSIITQTGR